MNGDSGDFSGNSPRALPDIVIQVRDMMSNHQFAVEQCLSELNGQIWKAVPGVGLGPVAAARSDRTFRPMGPGIGHMKPVQSPDAQVSAVASGNNMHPVATGYLDPREFGSGGIRAELTSEHSGRGKYATDSWGVAQIWHAISSRPQIRGNASDNYSVKSSKSRIPYGSEKGTMTELVRSVKSTMKHMDTRQSHRWRNEVANETREMTSSSLADVLDRSRLRTRLFDGWCLLIIVFDAFLIGFEADRTSIEEFQKWAKLSLTTWYIFEVLLRTFMRAKGFLPASSNAQHERFWALVDVLVTSLAVVDTCRVWLAHQTKVQSPSWLLLRLLRLLRVIRFFCRIRDMKKLIFSMACSAMTLFWSLVLLLLLIFFFAVFFTNATVLFLERDDIATAAAAHEQDFLEVNFGSVKRSMLSLYQAITSGRSWAEFSSAVADTHPLSEATFVIYIVLAAMGILNVVTAVFVESAMRASKSYKDLMMQEQQIKDRMTVRHMKQIFQCIDTDRSGTITLDELVCFLSDDRLGLQMYFQALELSANDTETLFNLLDADGSGEVDIAEFCDGCLHLGGPASSFDLNQLIYEQRRTNKHLLRFIENMATQLDIIRSRVEHTPNKQSFEKMCSLSSMASVETKKSAGSASSMSLSPTLPRTLQTREAIEPELHVQFTPSTKREESQDRGPLSPQVPHPAQGQVELETIVEQTGGDTTATTITTLDDLDYSGDITIPRSTPSISLSLRTSTGRSGSRGATL
mmetsp:Transcript_46479/g.108279  ORF Transcript_46479/g.108279 Transcript_46479/m.108279 type:complete len:747 (+) Transcript_46479:127-2367(+)